jgi:tetratricopeptide (TPR) repeat protein
LGYQANKSEPDECGTTFSSSGPTTVRDQIENAIVAASRGDYACGERAINVVLGSNPMSAVALRILGIILQLKGEPSRAMTYFARARQVDPSNRLISYYECLASQETPEAVPNCARAVMENDGLPEAHIMLANALLTQAPNEALKEADRAISIKPSGFASLLRAKALAALGH